MIFGRNVAREGNLIRKEPKTLYKPILFYTSRSDFPVRISAFRERLGTLGSSMGVHQGHNGGDYPVIAPLISTRASQTVTSHLDVLFSADSSPAALR